MILKSFSLSFDFQISPNTTENGNDDTKVRHGRGIQILNDNTMYIGQWKKDKAEGKGKIIHPHGSYYEGDFF